MRQKTELSLLYRPSQHIVVYGPKTRSLSENHKEFLYLLYLAWLFLVVDQLTPTQVEAVGKTRGQRPQLGLLVGQQRRPRTTRSRGYSRLRDESGLKTRQWTFSSAFAGRIAVEA